MHDLVIRGGTIIDGTGAPARTADLAIQGGRIAAVGRVAERGTREIEADGLLVTPGWVDVHTHYDGQATWDSYYTPSAWHGVTTVVMGNCGVGFAPAARDEHDWLISLMEGVEDIPGTALAEGIDWQWESFPQYLDTLEAREHVLDVGAQLPHGALRAYVMGKRGADHEAVPTADEIERMAQLACEALQAGALGFTTSRTRNHRTRDGEFTPSLTAGEEELIGIARGLERAGCGVIELVGDFADLDSEFALVRQMIQTAGRPASISVIQTDGSPNGWRKMLDHIGAAVDDGLAVKAQVAARPIGLLLGLQATMNPFAGRPSFGALQDLPHEERVARLRDPALRTAILSEKGPPALDGLIGRFDRIYLLGDPPDYEPAPERSVEAIAKARGQDAAECAYDLLLEDEGRALLYRPFANYSEGNLDSLREMILDPNTVPGLGDGGAHVGLICDGSFPTYWITHWARDRARGERLPLEWLVKQHTADTAAVVGLHDRGVLAPGMKADCNVIDFDALRLHAPEMRFDLPAGGKRLIQRATGYRATVVGGEVTWQDGEATGALPGKLVRGAQQPRQA